ncbi:expressed unknown protein [Seminavis robusta]|uniref:Uncharacterized protein n=1 Tax=Seminavis robusta TaxID=568900 RepID=A0A9N8HKG5_9STRA|nr:expressed unknown protein [Seminavis robusta]|eukprot:Sro837_g209091.1  (140) ;mRNA; r:1856-2275
MIAYNQKDCVIVFSVLHLCKLMVNLHSSNQKLKPIVLSRIGKNSLGIELVIIRKHKSIVLELLDSRPSLWLLLLELVITMIQCTRKSLGSVRCRCFKCISMEPLIVIPGGEFDQYLIAARNTRRIPKGRQIVQNPAEIQ